MLQSEGVLLRPQGIFLPFKKEKAMKSHKIILYVLLIVAINIVQGQEKSKLFKVYGFARLNATYNFQDLGGSDLFKPSAISVPLEDPRNSEFFMSAKQSRIGIEFNRDTEIGNITTVLEVDFHDTSDKILGLARIRHAYL